MTHDKSEWCSQVSPVTFSQSCLVLLCVKISGIPRTLVQKETSEPYTVVLVRIQEMVICFGAEKNTTKEVNSYVQKMPNP